MGIIFLSISLILFNIIFIRRLFLLKLISKYNELGFQLAELYIKKAKEEDYTNNNTLIELHFKTALLNIFFFNLNKYSDNYIFYSLKKIEQDIYMDLYKVYNISNNKEFFIEYFIIDLEILKYKDLKSQELRLSTIINLFCFSYNKNVINKEIERIIL